MALMVPLRVLRLLILFIAAGLSINAGDERITLKHGGAERSYWVHTPPSMSGRLPVLMALHGGGGNARQFKASAGLDTVADREGFLAVYPNGSGRLPSILLTWNAGDCCGYAQKKKVDDVAFLKTVIDDLDRRYRVDLRRIWVMGHSNGGMMAYRLAAAASDRIAAAASVGGAMITPEFHPIGPVPILHIHSVDDPRALYRGGAGPPFPFTNHRVTHRPAQETLQRWVGVNGCPSNPSTKTVLKGAEGTRDQGHSATHLVFSPCRSGFPVEHLKLTGIGHAWPGRHLSKRRERLVGASTELFQASEVIYTFVSRFRRPPASR